VTGAAPSGEAMRSTVTVGGVVLDAIVTERMSRPHVTTDLS
jgi:hypothetical protein